MALSAPYLLNKMLNLNQSSMYSWTGKGKKSMEYFIMVLVLILHMGSKRLNPTALRMAKTP